MDDQLIEKWDEVPLPEGATVEDVIWAVRRILAKPHVCQIDMRAGQPIQVNWFGLPNDTLDFDLPEPLPADVVRGIELTPLDVSGTSYELLGRAVRLLEEKGLHVSHVVVGEKSNLRKWLGIEVDPDAVQVAPIRWLMGGLVVQEPTYPKELLVLLASPSIASPLRDAKAGVRIFMDLEDYNGRGTRQEEQLPQEAREAVLEVHRAFTHPEGNCKK